MKAKSKTLALLGVVALVGGLALTGCASMQSGPTAEEKVGWYHDKDIVDYAFVAPYAVLPKRDDVTIMDSRPVRKYEPGHIPTAQSMPDLQFDELAAKMLPEDKGQLVIFYCGGYHCKLSHKSAYSAEKLGYTNVKVYAAGYPDWTAHGGIVAVGTQYMQQMVSGEIPGLIIDSRPKGRKYDQGHIPGAMSLPDSEFEKMAGMLPADKATPLAFYCGGYICKLSDNSATKAKALGYTNVVTYPAGFPAWKKQVGLVAKNVSPDTQGAAPMVAEMPSTTGGVISIAEFKQLLDAKPAELMLVDVRDPDEFERGSFAGAVNIPIGSLEDELFNLPEGKQIVYFCSSGGRGGEAYDLTKLLRPELNARFLDAVLTFDKNGGYEIKPHG